MLERAHRRDARGNTPGTEPLDALLEERIRALEASGAAGDFDRVSWIWMLLLGLALPIVLIILGWRA